MQSDLLSRRGTVTRTFLFLVASLGIMSVAQGQTPTPETTIKSTTRLVNVNVVVTDKQGQPVTGLTKDDFTIIDGGRPQKVSVFLPVDIRQPADTSVDVTLASDHTNVLRGRGADASVTILLLDTLNSKFSTQGYALERIRKFLRQLEPQDRIGVYVLGDRLKVVHGFTQDSSELVAAIRRYDESRSHASATKTVDESTGDLALDKFLSGAEDRLRAANEQKVKTIGAAGYSQAAAANAVRVTAAALQEIARQLSSVKGRKTLIWLTDDVPHSFLVDDEDQYLSDWRSSGGFNSPTDMNYQLDLDVERMIRLMNDSGIVVYPVDARGLESVDVDFRNHANGGRLFNSTGLGTSVAGAVPTANPALLEIANRTGGRAFYNRNDLETGVRQALNDSRVTYALAYYPDHGKWKGEWRKLQVKVNRPDVKVLARGGYFALADSRPTPPKDLNEFIAGIAASPVESTQLPMNVRLSGEAAKANDVFDVRVHFNPQPMLTNQDDGHWKGNIQLVFFQLDDVNTVKDVTTQTADIDLKPETYQRLIQKGVDMPAKLTWKSGTTLLCVILYDKNSGAVGSVRVPIGSRVVAEKQ